MLSIILEVRMKRKILIALSVVVSLSTLAEAQITHLNDAIDKAGRQRMLSQRMMKDYSMQGIKINFGNPKEELAKSSKLFSETLEDLIVFTKDIKDANNALLDVKKKWKTLKPALLATPDKEKALELFKKVDQLLASAHKATNLISATSKESVGEIINISGRQRMLSQRLGSLYMLKVWDIGMDNIELQKAMEQFSSAQKKLQAYPKNSEDVKKGLEAVKKDFMFFEVLGASKSKKYIPSLIARSSNKITGKMNEVTKLYADMK